MIPDTQNRRVGLREETIPIGMVKTKRTLYVSMYVCMYVCMYPPSVKQPSSIYQYHKERSKSLRMPLPGHQVDSTESFNSL